MKPGIIVLAPRPGREDVFNWVSEGWYTEECRHKPANQALFKKAERCIRKAKDEKEAKALLREAGFRIVRRVPPHVAKVWALTK